MPHKVLHYDRLKTIGEGTYGVVYKARNTRNNEWVALKRMYMDDDEEGIPSTSIREIALLKQLNHPNIVELKSTFFDSDRDSNSNSNSYGFEGEMSRNTGDLYLVFEHCSGDLKKYMNKRKNIPLKIKQIKNYLFQILNGISYCHSMSILHRDIKPQNILINEKTEQIKITDFGLSRCYVLPNRSWTHEIITLWYRPPEVLLGCSEYSIYVDIWSIGCVFAEMLNNNKPLFLGDSEISQLMHIFKKCGSPNIENWPNVFKDCKEYKNPSKYPKWERKPISSFCSRSDLKQNDGDDLLNQMLLLDPNKRITPKHALKHSFFLDMK